MKIILLLFISSLLLFSNGNIPYKNNILSSNTYILAKVHYKTKNYKKSYELFNKLFLSNPEELMVNFYQGLSASKLKKHNEAILAYERVLIIKEDFHRARLELALTLLNLGLKKEAKKEFKKVLLQPIPKNVRENINKILKSIKDEKLGLISTFIFELSFNDNVSSGSNKTYDFYIFGDKVSEDTPDVVSDFTHLEIISLLYNQKITSSTNLLHNILVLNNGYQNEDDYNLKVISYKPTLSFRNKNNIYSLVPGFDYIKTGTNVELKIYLLQAKYKYILKKKSFIGLSYAFKDLNFDEKENDFKINTLNLIYQKKYFKWKIILEKNIKEDDNSSSYENIFSLNENFYKYLFSTSYSYKNKTYDKVNSLFDSKREDTVQKLELNSKYLFSKKESLGLKFVHKNSKSNQNLYTYDKNSITLNYTRSFSW